ncbi:MAG: dihydrolipoyl dehydrogenase [Nitrospirae bacterium]|nr:dihydrolipoyl dehydrogenase [Nitrospirota bacterium]
MGPSPRIAVIGAGPGGYVAAIRAAQLGARVSLVEEQEVGGTCLNKGCIPSKALIFNAEVVELLKRAEEFGVRVISEPTYDVTRMLERKQRIVQTQVRGIHALLKSWGVALIKGRGRLIGPRAVEVADAGGTVQRVETDRVILATGSKPIKPPIFPFDGDRVITSEEALEPRVLPKSLLIVGAGVEGCEFGFLYQALGVSVTMVEMKNRPLATEDEEISSLVQREMNKRGIKLHLAVRVEKAAIESTQVVVTLSDGQTIAVDRILVSIGRRMNTEGLGLEEAGVVLGKRGEILVDDRMETRAPGVYAIGDAVGRIMLAHVASAEGKIAAANAVAGDRGHSMNYAIVPAGIFTLPEIGTVGLKEWEAVEQGLKIRIGRYPFRALGRAHTMDEIVGMVKVITEQESDRILGVHILGPHASDMIHEAAIAMRLGAKVSDIAEMIHAHPTLPEAMMEAAEDVHGSAIHLTRRKGPPPPAGRAGDGRQGP